jgi:hypothetical protein
MIGDGRLILPLPAGDFTAHGVSLHGADELAMLARLDGLGWEPTEGEDGERFCHDYFRPDGREVVGLYMRAPVVSVPCQRQQAEASVELRRRVAQA